VKKKITKQLQLTTVLYYNNIEVINLANNGESLRELLRILIRKLGILEKTEFSCCDITISQCHAIVEIGRKDEISLNELSDILGLDKSTMSRTINNLVEGNLVTRETHSGDRRYITITLTDQGQKMFKEIESSMSEYYSNILDKIPEEKRNQVLESLELLVDAVKENKCC
jgi:DNA-binding MarR family transcriptional regulator